MNYIPQLKWILISVINECVFKYIHLVVSICMSFSEWVVGVKYYVFWENHFLMELCFSNQTFYL